MAKYFLKFKRKLNKQNLFSYHKVEERSKISFEQMKKNETLSSKGGSYDKEPSWKVFDNTTEAGRLLKKLYGVNHHINHTVTYPKLKLKPSNKPFRSEWREVGGLAGKNDPTKIYFNKEKANAVKIPKVGLRGIATPLQINEVRPLKKTETLCKIDVERNALIKTKYRPSNYNYTSSEKEKNNLRKVFEYKGGFALPVELTHPTLECLTEEQRKEMSRIQLAKVQRKERLDGKFQSMEKKILPKQQEEESTKSILIKQILSEISERREFQLAMEEIGDGSPFRERTSHDISQRVMDLHSLDPNLAKKLKING